MVPLMTAKKNPAKEVTAAFQQAIGYVELNVETCAGCRTCEAVCSLSHDSVVSPGLARIWIVDHILQGRRVEGHTCRQCQGAECLHACPLNAITVDEATGAKIIDPRICTGCKLCMKACPQYPNTPIRYDDRKKICLKCDLCSGDPLCVKFCPEAALKLEKRRV